MPDTPANSAPSAAQQLQALQAAQNAAWGIERNQYGGSDLRYGANPYQAAADNAVATAAPQGALPPQPAATVGDPNKTANWAAANRTGRGRPSVVVQGINGPVEYVLRDGQYVPAPNTLDAINWRQ